MSARHAAGEAISLGVCLYGALPLAAFLVYRAVARWLDGPRFARGNRGGPAPGAGPVSDSDWLDFLAGHGLARRNHPRRPR